MRLILVPSDKTIIIDDEHLHNVQQDFSWVPSNVHALQWYENYGDIEYNDGTPNLRIEDLGIYQQAVTDHANEKIRLREEQEAYLNSYDWASEIRRQRSNRLTASDWVVIKARETNTDVPAEWLTYRQELRDLPSTVSESGYREICQDSTHSSWPTAPTT